MVEIYPEILASCDGKDARRILQTVRCNCYLCGARGSGSYKHVNNILAFVCS